MKAPEAVFDESVIFVTCQGAQVGTDGGRVVIWDVEDDDGELAQWLRHNEPGVNKEYSQKLAGRTIDALLDLTKDRLYMKRKNCRKDGLSYKERRVVLPEESEIPGETTFETNAPETADVGSE